ncbi:MAG: hypothetical protein M9954_05640 [Cyclobacteriaceae bacterium]|nr:hypothetical protein [Cyclobacteriaceae bacterium]MCW5903440.1 hypothetical protein [Cyclobacteriaceae bacterium]
MSHELTVGFHPKSHSINYLWKQFVNVFSVCDSCELNHFSIDKHSNTIITRTDSKRIIEAA